MNFSIRSKKHVISFLGSKYKDKKWFLINEGDEPVKGFVSFDKIHPNYLISFKAKRMMGCFPKESQDYFLNALFFVKKINLEQKRIGLEFAESFFFAIIEDYTRFGRKKEEFEKNNPLYQFQHCRLITGKINSLKEIENVEINPETCLFILNSIKDIKANIMLLKEYFKINFSTDENRYLLMKFIKIIEMVFGLMNEKILLTRKEYLFSVPYECYYKFKQYGRRDFLMNLLAQEAMAKRVYYASFFIRKNEMNLDNYSEEENRFLLKYDFENVNKEIQDYYLHKDGYDFYDMHYILQKSVREVEREENSREKLNNGQIFTVKCQGMTRYFYNYKNLKIFNQILGESLRKNTRTIQSCIELTQNEVVILMNTRGMTIDSILKERFSNKETLFSKGNELLESMKQILLLEES